MAEAVTLANSATLGQLLAVFRQRLDRLQQVLQEEQACIARREPEALAAVLQDKIQLLQETEDMDRQRIRLLADAGLGNDRQGMQALLQRQPDAQALASAWRRILDDLGRCQAVNEASGVVIRKGMQENRRLLDLLRGDDPDAAACYGMDGGTRSGSGRNLGKA